MAESNTGEMITPPVIDGGTVRIEGAAWTDTLSDATLRQSPSLTRYSSLEEFAKGHLELERKLGERPTGVQIPGAEATPEERAAFYKQLPGYPESPDKYTATAPQMPSGAELSQDQWQGFLTQAHALGLTDGQVAPLVQWWSQLQSESYLGIERAMAQHQQTGREALEKAWGPLTDRNLAIAMEGLRRETGGDLGFLEQVIGKDAQGTPVLLGNVPQFVQMAYELALAKGHDRFVAGGATGVNSAQAAQERIQAARGEVRAGRMTPAEFTALQTRLGPLAYGQLDRPAGVLTALDVATE